MKNLFFFIALLLTHFTFAQKVDKDIDIIKETLSRQENAWNRGDLDKFMNGYWESDDLLFIGKSGVTNGWQATLDNYKKSYPNTEAMGKLKFNLIKVEKLSKNVALVIGKWHLSRNKGDLQGHFSLTWKKINGTWVIIADHSS
ncbi:YybH family protein [Flammeovirga pacifica]|uniref:DUF4440 domain-containing protein n=1 Tax=Flammeovirga pacifica TaxID=915059 RepID=A0A1S1Z3M2_FLAPC|nr:DUF4440 domain-containing protein [Flammeovirga pacifica]OHX67886.1 DUF4440 domain-containing protein [Flammeovirga pacifica]